MVPRREAPHHAQVLVELEKNDMKATARLVDDIRREFAAVAGARVDVKEFEQGPPVQAPIAIVVIGDNLETLELISRDIENMIGNAPGTTNIDNPLGTSKTDLQGKGRHAGGQSLRYRSRRQKRNGRPSCGDV
jgi:Cu/Ag efflux pump CusA